MKFIVKNDKKINILILNSLYHISTFLWYVSFFLLTNHYSEIIICHKAMKKTVEVLRNSQRVKIWWELNKSSITLNITFELQAERFLQLGCVGNPPLLGWHMIVCLTVVYRRRYMASFCQNGAFLFIKNDIQKHFYKLFFAWLIP